MRESMEFDVVIVGAGVTGLAAACRLMQKAQEREQTLSVCVLEKGSELGAHVLSGGVMETRALDELFPDWQERGAPLKIKIEREQTWLLTSAQKGVKLPGIGVPKTMHNKGNYVVSLANLTRWMGEQAEALGVEIFPGFAANEVLYHEDGSVKGVATGDMGVGADGQPKDSYTEGMELHAKYTLFTEGVRGHLGKQVIERFQLDAGKDPQHYGIGMKEIWEIDPAKSQPGLVVHGAGWPLSDGASGGFFLYHDENNQVEVGLIVDLNYSNPWLSPFDEFQRLKHHPVLKAHLEGGTRVSYGARAVVKGGFNTLPKMSMPGAFILGCNAGTLNFAKIKGIHTGMKSGMLAAEVIADALAAGDLGGKDLSAFQSAYENSWLYDELYRGRNFSPALHKFGVLLGGTFNYIDQNIFGGKIPITLHDTHADHEGMRLASDAKKIDYPKPDGKLSFDRLSSVYLSNTVHEEDQPCHLVLKDPDLPMRENWPKYAEPAQRYCPAGVYEVLEEAEGPKLQINFTNCVHCKTCDIKDPAQNIVWIAPEGGGGPNYPNM
ncbi:electron transfer flavoprotein-ubiquinone oxidoreductase [Nitrincola tapanii]|uniref:Electron transfer flavoprotein-ubiquinone oxidoreductase n=1 Tax=Nitrincola tapanii TaxID=1708751 RepID=A0A5A9W2V2_9GAMM|nr:electron transfer flavoprotein-ubiquinone oxidoreductase [Nitrincola tapanii]KAA0875100.1 electron transfer flavoprotein-ubiquinone oxidoreductase [Nitrincola tapanii]